LLFDVAWMKKTNQACLGYLRFFFKKNWKWPRMRMNENEVLLVFLAAARLLSDRKSSPKILFKSTKHGS
jgi:hypothetical protein